MGLARTAASSIGYEAGPTGYGLCKGLLKKGYDCVIMAPTTIKKSSSDKRRKTDRGDAKMLAMALATIPPCMSLMTRMRGQGSSPERATASRGNSSRRSRCSCLSSFVSAEAILIQAALDAKAQEMA